MRFPYVIDVNTKIAYEPSEITLQLLGEIRRVLFPERLEFGDDECPYLTTFCVIAIAENFVNKPLLNELPGADRDNLLEILPLDLPLELVVPLIDDEFYWKRRFLHHFQLYMKHKMEDWTWKRIYLESHMEKLLEEAQPQHQDEEDMKEILQLSCPYVRRLIISQLQAWKPPLTWEKDEIPEKYPTDHISFVPVLPKLENLEEFDLIYGMTKLDIDAFDPRFFDVSVEDCRKLGSAVIPLEKLTILKLHRSKIGGMHTQALCHGLAENKSIIQLELCHCEIDDHGALCVAKMMTLHSKLEILDLANNQIRKIGSEALGFALLSPTCCPLKKLSMRLNPLEHEGTMGILRALIRLGDKPKEVNLSGCLFDDETSLRVTQMLRINTSLESMDISNNWFGEENGRFLVESLTINPRIKYIDLRETDIIPNHISIIKKILLRNLRGDTEIEESEAVEEEQEVIMDIVEEPPPSESDED